MRHLFINIAATALIVFGAFSAQAASITLSGLPTGDLAQGDTFTITLTGDFNDFAATATVFQLNFSTFIDGNVLAVVGGSAAAQIFGWEAAPGSFVNPLPLVPGFVPNTNLDPNTVRTGAWLSGTPQGFAGLGDWAPVLATVTLQAVGLGGSQVDPGFAGGDTFQTTAGVVADQVSFFGGGVVNVVPEPTTALLVGLGLVGLGVSGRRR